MSRGIKNKKGVSVVVGYVLLIVLAVAMGGIMYAWMKQYVPQEPIECPEGTSIAIVDYTYNSTTDTLSLNLSNNGRFDVAGYFIRSSNNSGLDLGTFDISNFTSGANVSIFNHAVVIGSNNSNLFIPGLEIEHYVNTLTLGTLYRIEITPVRWQTDKNKRLRFVSCGAGST